MADATGEAKQPPLRVTFDRRIKLEFHGAGITSDGGLLADCELDHALGLTTMGVSALAEGRRGKNIRHRLLGLVRQAVYGRLAGYEDVNDAARLARDPAMRAIVGREGLDRAAASTSQMGRFETEWLAAEANLASLADLSGAWIDRVHERKPPDGLILDLDSSASPTYGEKARPGTATSAAHWCTFGRAGAEPRSGVAGARRDGQRRSPIHGPHEETRRTAGAGRFGRTTGWRARLCSPERQSMSDPRDPPARLRGP